jgi:deoxyribodipyrimidine photo-lyase
MEHQRSLFIFRRDLRLEDNTALNAALQSSKEVIPCFIFNPLQVENFTYRSDNALLFMVESLFDLKKSFDKIKKKLYIFSGKPEEIVEEICKKLSISALFLNEDYTPFSRKRDEEIKKVCDKYHVEFLQKSDYVLHSPIKIIKEDGRSYEVFTSYFQKAKKYEISNPSQIPLMSFFDEEIDFSIELEKALEFLSLNENPYLAVRGGREKGLKILEKIKEHEDYALKRDYPSLDSTTHLSAYLKFGCISIREAYWTIRDNLGNNHPLIRQLFWRDFFVQVAFHHPEVFGKPFKTKYEGLQWQTDARKFQRWKDGMTGFPIVDAGMRELNKTGYMHNRVRMITASFLVKDLHIDWRWGEKYFAQKLVDYDPMINNGNWQWCASTGCDSQPYFRIFNPWLQQKKFDPNAEYIKKWIPEISSLTPQQIHNVEWVTNPDIDYPEPMVEHAIEAKIAKEMYGNL